MMVLPVFVSTLVLVPILFTIFIWNSRYSTIQLRYLVTDMDFIQARQAQ